MSSRKLNRRSFFGRVMGGALVAGSAMVALQPGTARAVDRDPTDPATGVTDRDPTDPPGHRPPPCARPTGYSDRDPVDPASCGRQRSTGGGTIGGPNPGARPRSGLTDHDSSDPAGNGTVTGITDRDPTDRSTRGRGVADPVH
jgi:hypothetical protein